MIMLDNVQENAVRDNLKKRYAKDEIYTYIGDVLISVNPFKNISNMYSDFKLRDYRAKYPYELPPHIFAIAESAYRGIITDRKSQAIIITGESGAGKTEASKHIMSYLASISTSAMASNNTNVRSKSFVQKKGAYASASLHLTQQQQDQVRNQILKSNPLLESFGNAKTVRNNNSSRFGKYMEIFFSLQGTIIGGQVTQFLLEKSRVISQTIGERNFHIFYQLFTDKALKKSLELDSPQQFRYLNQSNCTEVKDIDDAKDFSETKDAFNSMGVKKATQDRIYELLAAVLHMGNIEFAESPNSGCKVINMNTLALVARLLSIEPLALESGLTTKTVEAGGRKSMYLSPLRADEAAYVRDALAKALYGKVFDLIVKLVNRSIERADKRMSENKHTSTPLSIGILDIYGFEIFERNSFEQLCINYVNERLQKTFIELTLELEQKEYASEGIKWEKIPYIDNSPCLTAIDGKMGVFSLLNEACLMKKTNVQFLESLKQNLKNNTAMVWNEIDFSDGLFIMKHYAGDVAYSAEEFVQKNTDSMLQSLVTMLSVSNCSVITDMFSSLPNEGDMGSSAAATTPRMRAAKDVSKRPPMIATQFKKQVDELIEKLYQCNTHYVRCMKPNQAKASNQFLDDQMLHQIRYLGLLENIRVRRAGFVYRHTYSTFAHHYGLILHKDPSFKELKESDPKEASVRIVKHLLSNTAQADSDKQMYALGKTKVFIRTPELVFALEEMREQVLPDFAIRIQKQYRRYKAIKFYIELKNEMREKMAQWKKKRRRVSINRTLVGDNLNLQELTGVNKILTKNKDHASVMFSGIVQKTNRRNKIQERVLMITRNNFYTLARKVKKTGPVYTMKRRVPLSDITNVTLSPLTDNFIIIGCSNKHDYVLESDDKTEIVGVLIRALKDNENRELPVQISDRFQYKVSKSESRTLTFVQSTTDAPTPVQFAKGQATVFVRNEPEARFTAHGGWK